MKKEKVLVIEDEKGTRNAIKILLELNNIEVSTTDDIALALKKLESDSYNAVLCGIQLAQQNEYAVLSAIKDNPKYFKIPLILLADNLEDADYRNAMDNGADDIVIKPFSSKALLHSIKLRIERSRKHQRFYDNEYNERVFSLMNKDFSQELITSLNGISNATFLLESLPGNEEIEGIKELVQIINTSRFRLQRISQNLRTYSFLNADKSAEATKERKNVVLQNVLQMVLDNYENQHTPEFKKTDVDVLQIGLWNGNDNYIRTLFTELIDNALKFNTTAYRPQIKLQAVNDDFTFSVTNYAKGNPGFTIDDVRPFTKFHHDLSYNGLGLGLAVCKSICMQMGYRLSINKQGNYLTFTIESSNEALI